MTAPTLVPVPVNTPGILQFSHEGDLIWIGLQLAGLAVALAFLFTGFGARLRTALDRLTGGRRWLVLTLFAWTYMAAATLALLPLRYENEVGHWAQWGFPSPGLGPWLAAQAVTLAALMIAAALFLWIPFALIARSPRLWWLWLTAIAAPAFAVALVVGQLVIGPMTTRYEPLADPVLKAQIQAMADRCGAGTLPLFIGGNDLTVVGIGPFSRILVSRDALTTQTHAQLMTSMAHELKHYRMGDNWLAMAVVTGLILAGAVLVQVLGRAAIRLWGTRFGFASLSDPAALPLMAFILMLSWAAIGLPVFNAVQRHVELEADRFALEVTHDNRALGEWQAAMAKRPWAMNVYDPFFELIFANHPSQADRVRLANDYRPWEHGRPGVYDRICKR